MTPTDTTAPEAPDAPTADTPAQTPTAASTPEERAKQFQQFMAKIMGDMSRLRQQTDYVARHFHGEVVDVHARLDHFEAVLGMICESLHIEMPKMAPKLLDAKVELTATLDEEEVCEFRAAYSATKHPIYGHIQAILGTEDQAQVAPLTQLHPIVVMRLDEAFTALRQTEDFVDGQFYYVRLGLIHAQPINEASVPYALEGAPAALPPAANDDAAPAAAETGDVQSE